MPRYRRPVRVAAVLFTGAALAFSLGGVPAQAVTSAGLAWVSGTKVGYKSARGKQSTVVVTRSGRTVTIDDRIAIKIGKGCQAVKGDKTKARCTTAKTTTRVNVWTYDRNDRITNSSDLPMSADAGTGNDRVVGGPRGDSVHGREGNDRIWGHGGNDMIVGHDGNDVISGGDGNDSLHDMDGNDTLYGGDGNDWFGGDNGNDKYYGGAGNDTFAPLQPTLADADHFSGGSGYDSAQYGYSRAVSLDLDGVKGDDGMKGEGDTLAADVEHLYGGDGNDRLVGNDRDNLLDGGEGNDTVHGLGGADTLYGKDGTDKLYGGAGDDWLDATEFSGKDTTTDVIDGGTHGAIGDGCVVRAGAATTGCENLYHP